MKLINKYIPKIKGRLFSSIAYKYDKDRVLSYWYRGDYNVGDLVGPYLLNNLFFKKPFHIRDIKQSEIKNKYVLYSVGSILNSTNRENMVVWGSGSIRDKIDIRYSLDKVYLIRGPLTYKNLVDKGIETPKSFGDPALILSDIYKPKNNNKEFEVGITPNHKDVSWAKSIFKNTKINKVKLIDPRVNIHNYINQVVKCNLIVSTSLHGIIIAHSYGIPTLWIRKNNNKNGGDFKYYDYYYSFNTEPVFVDFTEVSEINSSLISKNKFIKPDISELKSNIYNTSKKIINDNVL